MRGGVVSRVKTRQRGACAAHGLLGAGVSRRVARRFDAPVPGVGGRAGLERGAEAVVLLAAPALLAGMSIMHRPTPTMTPDNTTHGVAASICAAYSPAASAATSAATSAPASVAHWLPTEEAAARGVGP